jgi:hypothetical protein
MTYQPEGKTMTTLQQHVDDMWELDEPDDETNELELQEFAMKSVGL